MTSEYKGKYKIDAYTGGLSYKLGVWNEVCGTYLAIRVSDNIDELKAQIDHIENTPGLYWKEEGENLEK